MNSRLSSQNCNVGFSIVDGSFQSYGIAFCDRKISPKSFIASSIANFPNLNGDSKISGNASIASTNTGQTVMKLM